MDTKVENVLRGGGQNRCRRQASKEIEVHSRVGGVLVANTDFFEGWDADHTKQGPTVEGWVQDPKVEGALPFVLCSGRRIDVKTS
jgi:hypothetical protein